MRYDRFVRGRERSRATAASLEFLPNPPYQQHYGGTAASNPPKILGLPSGPEAGRRARRFEVRGKESSRRLASDDRKDPQNGGAATCAHGPGTQRRYPHTFSRNPRPPRVTIPGRGGVDLHGSPLGTRIARLVRRGIVLIGLHPRSSGRFSCGVFAMGSH